MWRMLLPEVHGMGGVDVVGVSSSVFVTTLCQPSIRVGTIIISLLMRRGPQIIVNHARGVGYAALPVILMRVTVTINTSGDMVIAMMIVINGIRVLMLLVECRCSVAMVISVMSRPIAGAIVALIRAMTSAACHAP